MYVNKVGHALVSSMELEIGGQRIDKYYGRYQDLIHSLTCPAEKEEGYAQMTGAKLGQPSNIGLVTSDSFAALPAASRSWAGTCERCLFYSLDIPTTSVIFVAGCLCALCVTPSVTGVVMMGAYNNSLSINPSLR